MSVPARSSTGVARWRNETRESPVAWAFWRVERVTGIEPAWPAWQSGGGTAGVVVQTEKLYR